ncbi:MAG: hypothetical protein IJV48_07245 [Ruminococcus sp.]|nr:hypothetical protein [Ruminococcus sp.]
MATSQYTPNLHLNAWTDSDRPKRADFVSDNTIIDTQLGGHIADSAIHLNAEERAKLTEPFTFALYAGSGETTRTISLGFRPKFAIVFKRNVPPVVYSGGVNIVNAGYACYGHGSSTGLSVTGTGVTVSEAAAATDGVRVSLNESGSQYTIVAFK